MASRLHHDVAALVLGQRWAALATLDGAGPAAAPAASMVAYAPEPGLAGLLLFLSGLAAHTRHLLAEPRAALAISEPDLGGGDPQTLARVTLSGRAAPLPRDAAGFPAAWERYAARFPAAAPRLALPDFVLFRFTLEEARYVGGFARAATLTVAELRAAAAAAGEA